MARCWSIPLLLFGFLTPFSALAGASPQPADDDAAAFGEEMAAPTPHRYALGIFYLSGGSEQGTKTFTANDSVQYQVSSYKGATKEPGLFFDYQYSPRWTTRLYLGYQTTALVGAASQLGVPLDAQTVELDETLIAMGGEFKYSMFGGDHGFWLGFGMEYDRGLTIRLSLGGVSVPTFSEDLPNLIQLLGSVGYDFKVSGDWLITPELRLSDAPAAKPSIFSYQATIGFGRYF
jgi:hypothetical protein